MYNYAMGLDIGIASVGWAVLALDAQEKPCGIIDLGVRTFEKAEGDKGKSLAQARREARGMRRNIRRRRHRKERIRNLIISENIINEQQLEHLFDGKLEDIYALRVKALDEPVSAEQFARILIHISQRRGFKSNRKDQSKGGEEGKLLKAVKDNKEKIADKSYRSVAEMMLKDELFSEHKRNKDNEHIADVDRKMIEDEVKLVFEAQRNFKMPFATEDIEKKYWDILSSQRPYDEGPGKGTTYGGLKEAGKCTLEGENGELRASKACYSFELFNLWQNINHIRIMCDGDERSLSDSERQALFNLAHKKAALTYKDLRKELKLGDDERFKYVRYSVDKPVDECEKKEKFNHFIAYHEIKKVFEKTAKGRYALLPLEHKNAIGEALVYGSEEKIEKYLRNEGLEDCDIMIAKTIALSSKRGHLSVVACNKLLPYLEKGMVYSNACEAAGYDFNGHDETERAKFLKLDKEDKEGITSPIALRAASQTVKVINAIIRKYGSPTFVNIELARDMAKSYDERQKTESEFKENSKYNDRIMERLRKEFGLDNPKGEDLVKLKLYEEQGGISAYSGKPMELNRLFESGYAEVDHIIPYSISFDNSYNNKVLVLTKENREKGNRLPLEYLTGEARERFIVWAKTNVRNNKKQQKLLKKQVTEADISGFRERTLQDTRHVSRFMYNLINDRLEFAPSTNGRKKRVTAVNGGVTAYLRKRWGIEKNRANGDKHHAADAVVIACTTDGFIRRISEYCKEREINRSVSPHIPYPWDNFGKELEARMGEDPEKLVKDLKLPFYLDTEISENVRPIFVSKMPTRKIKGEAHEATVRSTKAGEGFTVSRTELKKLKFKDGEIKGYYKPENDPLLYNALCDRLRQFDGDAEKAFAEPLYKPNADGSRGSVVKKVWIQEKSTITVPVHGGKGIANNGDMVRIDVFRVEGDGYYFVPIYVPDTLKPELPNKACTRGRLYSEWKEMKDEDFLFSLYKNDLVEVTSKSNLKLNNQLEGSSRPEKIEQSTAKLYFNSADISTASITGETHDSAYKCRSLGIKTLVSIEKYTVDVLGEYHKVGKEKRQGFNVKGKTKCHTEIS